MYKFLQFIMVCIIFALFSACFPQDELFSIRLALSGNPSTLDPHATTETLTFQVLRSIYDTLLEPDEQGQLQPALARSWEISPDNLSIILNLRKDVSFHDGSPFDGNDVIWSIKRLQSPEFASPSSGEFEAIEDIVLVDDFTIRIVLKVPKASLLYTLASGWAAILPSEAIDSGHNFANNPIGTGPFVFDEWITDEQISLSKNTDYWSATGEAEQIVFQIIPVPSIQVQSLISGQADILYIVNEEYIPILEASEDITIETLDSSLVVVMAINNSRAPLSDLRFRRALNFAVDKQSVLDVAYGGGTVVGTFNDAGNAFYADFSDLYPYDPEAAAQLIGETGYEAGQVLDLVLPQNFALHVQAGKLYQEMLRKAGIHTQIRLVDWPTWLSDVYGKADYDLTVIGHTGKLDPDGRFSGHGRGESYVRWNNEEVLPLIEQGSRVINIAERREIYREVQRIFAEEVPYVFVGSPIRHIAYRSDIEGFIMTPALDTFDFRQVRRVR